MAVRQNRTRIHIFDDKGCSKPIILGCWYNVKPRLIFSCFENLFLCESTVNRKREIGRTRRTYMTFTLRFHLIERRWCSVSVLHFPCVVHDSQIYLSGMTRPNEWKSEEEYATLFVKFSHKSVRKIIIVYLRSLSYVGRSDRRT